MLPLLIFNPFAHPHYWKVHRKFSSKARFPPKLIEGDTCNLLKNEKKNRTTAATFSFVPTKVSWLFLFMALYTHETRYVIENKFYPNCFPIFGIRAIDIKFGKYSLTISKGDFKAFSGWFLSNMITILLALDSMIIKKHYIEPIYRLIE